MLKIFVLFPLLVGCARMHYVHIDSSGARTEIDGHSFGVKGAFDGLTASDSEKSRRLSVNGAQFDESDAAKAYAEILPGVVKGAVEGAIMAAKHP